MINIIQDPSPNYNSNMTIVPKVIVLHWTAGYFDPSVQWLKTPAAQVSSQFVINRDGSIIKQLVWMNRRAWHAGPSYHPNFGTNINSCSVGIECEGPPSLLKETGWKQSYYDALVELIGYIQNKMKTIEGITDHSTISPNLGKTDVLGGTGVDTYNWKYIIEKSGLPDLATPEMRLDVRKYWKLPVS